MSSYRKANLDEIAAKQWPHWIPVRHFFGIDAFDGLPRRIGCQVRADDRFVAADAADFDFCPAAQCGCERKILCPPCAGAFELSGVLVLSFLAAGEHRQFAGGSNSGEEGEKHEEVEQHGRAEARQASPAYDGLWPPASGSPGRERASAARSRYASLR